MINRGFRDLFASFVAHEVRFVIVGGYAVSFHGHPRYTKDVDVFIDPDPANAERVRDRYGDVEVCYLGLDDLLRSKRAAGRAQDLLDADELERRHSSGD